MERKYPRIRFQKRLEDLRKDVEDVGQTSLEAYKKALDAFITYDEELVEEVMKTPAKLDEMNYRLEHRAMSIIASEQPVAKDLRFIEACIKVGSHLKRMGALASNIAEVAKHIKDENVPEKPMNDIRHMGNIVEGMVGKSISSFLNQDMDLVREIRRDDDKVDDLFDKALEDISKSMFQEKDSISYLIYVLFVARFLERIADRAENIGDRTIFMITCEKREVDKEE
ncbi:phosphate signaling complex protein PhoU [Methanobacterium aggregans]|uniref:phosphate signaling complex protein PhoU n=1 Tax=Methanobacterium aggregans TaxID=1615586 RepID=UPI001AE6266E|nr:phosphate signaling complex protein PhoU [Methanobacterium aggregans]MBP2047022.1 phosphate transport system protein [Methanobacterium aggregans]